MVAILLLEMVNYIEHYGLERSRLSNGRCNSVQCRQSGIAVCSLITSIDIHSLQACLHLLLLLQQAG